MRTAISKTFGARKKFYTVKRKLVPSVLGDFLQNLNFFPTFQRKNYRRSPLVFLPSAPKKNYCSSDSILSFLRRRMLTASNLPRTTAWVRAVHPSSSHSFTCANTKIRARIFKLLRSSRIDSKESIPPAYVAWRVGTTTLFLRSVPNPHIDCLKIPAQIAPSH